MQFTHQSFQIHDSYVSPILKKVEKLSLNPDKFTCIATIEEAIEAPNINKIKMRWIFRMILSNTQEDAIRYIADDRYAIDKGIISTNDNWITLIDHSLYNFKKGWNDFKKNTEFRTKALPELQLPDKLNLINKIHNLLSQE